MRSGGVKLGSVSTCLVRSSVVTFFISPHMSAILCCSKKADTFLSLLSRYLLKTTRTHTHTVISTLLKDRLIRPIGRRKGKVASWNVRVSGALGGLAQPLFPLEGKDVAREGMGTVWARFPAF